MQYKTSKRIVCGYSLASYVRLLYFNSHKMWPMKSYSLNQYVIHAEIACTERAFAARSNSYIFIHIRVYVIRYTTDSHAHTRHTDTRAPASTQHGPHSFTLSANIRNDNGNSKWCVKEIRAPDDEQIEWSFRNNSNSIKYTYVCGVWVWVCPSMLNENEMTTGSRYDRTAKRTQ